jgi:general stress protein YciG
MDTQQQQHHHQGHSPQASRTRNRGFASMDAGRQREIARKGGRAAHEKGKAHEFTADEARAAGRKGGEKVSVNRRHMAEIGRRGGRSSAARRRPGGDAGADMASHEPRGAEATTASQPAATPAPPVSSQEQPPMQPTGGLPAGSGTMSRVPATHSENAQTAPTSGGGGENRSEG